QVGILDPITIEEIVVQKTKVSELLGEMRTAATEPGNPYGAGFDLFLGRRPQKRLTGK
ncbi:MAG: hypothetical protein RLZZ15_472, partial [Verrucomicrobiota bacterium]